MNKLEIVLKVIIDRKSGANRETQVCTLCLSS